MDVSDIFSFWQGDCCCKHNFVLLESRSIRITECTGPQLTVLIVCEIFAINLIYTATNKQNEQFRLPDRGGLTFCISQVNCSSFFQSYLPSKTITCCCSRRIALWRYPPKAVLLLVCVWVCVCRRFLERFSSAGFSTRSSWSSRTPLFLGGPLASFAVPVPLFNISGVEWGCSFWGQLHCAYGADKKKMYSKQAMETQMAMKLMTKAKATVLSPPLSLSGPAILCSALTDR